MLREISHQLWTTEYFSIPLLTLTEVKWNDLFPRLPFPPQDTALSRRRPRERLSEADAAFPFREATGFAGNPQRRSFSIEWTVPFAVTF